MRYSKSFNLYEPNPVKEMALTPLIQFPVFAPTPPNPPHNRPATEVRFSRWNNANAEKFNREKHTQKEIEDQLRFQKRYDSALNIAYNYNPAPPTPLFKSTGTPSAPSKPSIPGKKSKYSKTPQNSIDLHPAFRPLLKHKRLPMKKAPPTSLNENEESESETQEKYTADVKIDEKGLSYEFPDAPFVYQYSYTETPKVKPLGIREPLVAPFEPATMGRPWTGRKPLPPSKKKLPEFDSFKLPPPQKKGVKTVQAPGPYLPGSGPKYVRSREEILGEQLTKEEVKELVESCKKCKRQLNMGRDGFTHNMLDNIHAHWKRRRVCKIKCKGVCTVDMDNVRKQLEEKTGGLVIYSTGGVIYLFRGRNYNFKMRPRFPLMLWKPVTPVYPRLIKRVPDGLTLEVATEMRRKGRHLASICKLAKNGVYCDLVKNVREAFEACELVRINCQGLNASDYRKIGAKLKDLVPCVLISFENEHILIWRGQDWKSSLSELKNDVYRVREFEPDAATYAGPTVEGQTELLTASTVTNSVATKTGIEEIEERSYSLSVEDVGPERSRDHGKELVGDFNALVNSETLSASCEIHGSQNPLSQVKELQVDAATYAGPTVEGQTELLTASTSTVTNSIVIKTGIEEIEERSDSLSMEDAEPLRSRDHGKELAGDFSALVNSETLSASSEIHGSQNPLSQVKELEADAVTDDRPTVEGQTELLTASNSTVTNSTASSVEHVESKGSKSHGKEMFGDFTASEDSDTSSAPCEIHGSQNLLAEVSSIGNSDSLMDVNGNKEVFDGSDTNLSDTIVLSPGSETILGSNVGDDDLSEPVAVVPLTVNKFEDVCEDKKLISELSSSIAPASAGIHLLLKLAVESGSAIVLEDSSLDADIVYEKAVNLAKSAPPGPVFRHGPKKLVVQGCDEQPNDDLATKEAVKTSDHKVTVSSQRATGKKSSKRQSMKDIRADYLNIAPQGSLRVDELAKLLSW